MPTQDLIAALTPLIFEAETLVERIEKKSSSDAALATHCKAITEQQLEKVYAAEWLARGRYRTWEETRGDINAAIAVLRSLNMEVGGGGWRERVGELWNKVQSKLGKK